MSSLNDTKAKYWKNGVDTNLAAILSDEDAIDRLLVNTDFDSFDMPEINTKPHAFNNNEYLVDINTLDDFHDSKLFLEDIVEKTPLIIAEPIAIADNMGEAAAIPVAAENVPVIAVLDNTQSPHPEKILSSFVADHSDDPSIMANDAQVVLPTPAAIEHEPLTALFDNDKYDKSVVTALDSAVVTNPVAISNPATDPIIIDYDAKEALSTLTTPENEPFAPRLDRDKYDKSIIIAPVDAQEIANPVETISSLVENHTKMEKVALSSDFILNNFIAQNPITQTENTAPQPQRSDSDKRIQTSVTITSTINETVHDSEWTLFKTEQGKLNTQHRNRIAELEKSLKKAMLFSHIASIVAGIALIAVVSGLL